MCTGNSTTKYEAPNPNVAAGCSARDLPICYHTEMPTVRVPRKLVFRSSSFARNENVLVRNGVTSVSDSQPPTDVKYKKLYEATTTP